MPLVLLTGVQPPAPSPPAPGNILGYSLAGSIITTGGPITRPLSPAAAIALWLGLSGAGCVHAYQPMTGLQSPVVVDPQAANFVDLRLSVYCLQGDLLDPQEAVTLCQNIGLLFENQGAVVQTSTTARGLRDAELADELGQAAEAAGPADLVLEIRSRQVHQSNDSLWWAASISTLTIVPAITESTFAQDIVVRDASGFVLVSDSLQGRLIRRFGVGAWAGNAVLNKLVREEPDKVTEDTAGENLSEDLYRQLSQLVFNADVQRKLLQEGASWE